MLGFVLEGIERKREKFNSTDWRNYTIGIRKTLSAVRVPVLRVKAPDWKTSVFLSLTRGRQLEISYRIPQRVWVLIRGDKISVIDPKRGPSLASGINMVLCSED